MTAQKPVFRFAPSPNGLLHLGHAFSALYTWQMAKKFDGKFLVRIEDIDEERTRQNYIDQIFDDLAWLGLTWEEPVLHQSSRMSAYKSALDKLKAGGLIYPSYLTRKHIKQFSPTRPKDPDGAPLITREDEPEEIEAQAAGIDPAWRLDMEKAVACLNSQPSFAEHQAGPSGETGTQDIKPQIWGNVVLARKFIPTSYHLSVVVDDAFQNISHVTRGQDLFYATHIHVLLQKLLNLPTPHYFHHRLISTAEGHKLSKSALDKSLKSLREEGVTLKDIIKLLAPIHD